MLLRVHQKSPVLDIIVVAMAIMMMMHIIIEDILFHRDIAISLSHVDLLVFQHTLVQF